MGQQRFAFAGYIGNGFPRGQLPFFEQVEYFQEEVFQQGRGPAVPGLGAGGHRISHREQVEHFEAVDVIDAAGAVKRRFFVVDVPSGSGFGQQQMLPHQEGHGISGSRTIAFFGQDALYENLALFGMIAAGLSFADVMQERSPEKQLALFDVVIDPNGQIVWQVVRGIRELFKGFYGAQQVPIDGVNVVFVVLNAV